MFKTLSWIWIVDNLHTTRLVENIIFSHEYCFYRLLQYEESIYTRIHSNEEIRRKLNKKDALKYFNSKTREIFFAGNSLFYNTIFLIFFWYFVKHFSILNDLHLNYFKGLKVVIFDRMVGENTCKILKKVVYLPFLDGYLFTTFLPKYRDLC